MILPAWPGRRRPDPRHGALFKVVRGAAGGRRFRRLAAKSGGGAEEPRPASEFAQEQLPSDCDSGLALCSGAGIMVGLKFEKSLFTGVK